jgi:membrane fusion protein (multidrug efflux system)
MKRRLALFGLVLIALIIAGATSYKVWQSTHKAEDGKRGGTPSIIAYNVGSRTFTDRIQAVGTAMANEAATLTATASDTVTAINFEEGTLVTKDTILVQLNDAEERAEMVDAQKAFDRYTKLAKSSATSEAQRDTSAATLAMAEARLRDLQIIAPFDGIAGFRNVSLGDLVTPGMEVTSVYDIDPIKLEFTLPESYLSILESGLEIEARTSAWPDKTFKGKISVVDPRINAATRAVSLKAEIPNPDNQLKPGLLMTVNVVKDERTALAIPEGAIIQQGEKQNVYVIGADKKATLTPVTIGSREAGYLEVTNGLKEGDIVVAEGLLKVRPGAAVEISETKTIEDMINAATEMATPRKQEALKQETTAK